jgi:molecular chaperone DnaK (HSP70)
MSEWTLAIDFGTTYTCAVMSFGHETEVVLVNGETRMPSAVLSDPSGNLVVGKLAELQGSSMPDRLERNPKRRLGDGIFLLGGEPVQVIKAVSEIMKTVSDEATRTRGGEVPSAIRLTHPARWAVDGVYVRTLAEAAALARLPDPSFISEPVAAARFFGRRDLQEETPIAVYDLGGGTFDTTVLVRRGESFELLGRPGGIPDLGGEDFDEGVFQLLGHQLTEETWENVAGGADRDSRRIRLELRRQAREAKEALSVRPEWTIAAPAPLDQTLRITRGDLEDLIRPKIEETLDELERTITDSGTTVDALAGIYLAGGSSRIPLVQRMVTERFGPKVQMLDEPKTVVARGAAMAESDELGDLATHDSLTAGVAAAHKAAHGAGADASAASSQTPSTELRPPVPPMKPQGRTRLLAGIGAAMVVIAVVVALVLLTTKASPHHSATATTATTSSTRATIGATSTTINATSAGKACTPLFCVTLSSGWTQNTSLSDNTAVVLERAGHPGETVKIGYLEATAQQTATDVVTQTLIPARLQAEGASSSSCAANVSATPDGTLAKGVVCFPKIGSPGTTEMAYYQAYKKPINNPEVLVYDITDDQSLTPSDQADPGVTAMFASVTPTG